MLRHQKSHAYQDAAMFEKKLLSFERCGEAFDFDSIKAYI